MPVFLQPAMIRSSGQRLHCVRFLCLCALCLGASCAREAWLSSVMSRCVGVGFLACARHAQHFALQNGSIGPKLLNSPAARPHKKGLFIAKGEGAPGKGGFLSTFFGFCGVFHCSRCFWCTYWEHDCTALRTTDYGMYMWNVRFRQAHTPVWHT